MLDAPSPSELEPTVPAPATPAWHGEMLRELAELGMRMARAVTVGAEMRAQAGEASAADEAASTLALQRAAKMVRLTVALDKKLLEPPQVRKAPAIELERQQRDNDEAEAQRAEAAADAVWVIRSLWKLVGKPLVQNTVELAIQTEVEGADRERLRAELHEVLVEREEELIALGPGQYYDTIAGILKALGLSGGPAYAKASAGRPPRPGSLQGGPQAAHDAPGLVARTHPPP